MKNGSRHVIITEISRQLVIIEHRKQFVSKVLLVLLKFGSKETDHFQDTWSLKTFPSIQIQTFQVEYLEPVRARARNTRICAININSTFLYPHDISQ